MTKVVELSERQRDVLYSLILKYCLNSSFITVKHRTFRPDESYDLFRLLED